MEVKKDPWRRPDAPDTHPTYMEPEETEAGATQEEEL